VVESVSGVEGDLVVTAATAKVSGRVFSIISEKHTKTKERKD